ncbi:MAG: hypothetical protein ABH812_00325 [bacterium]
MSLTKLKELIQKYGPFVILGLIIFFILFYSVKIGVSIYTNNKGANIVTNPIFGVINNPEIKNTTTSAGLKFKLDTIEGRPVTATRSANVYFLPPQTTKFGYRDKISNIAAELGFNNIDSYTLNGDAVEFNEAGRSLTINITNFDFDFKYDYKNDTDLFTRSIIPTKEEVEKKTKEILKSLGKFSNEFDQNLTITNYFFFNSDKKVEVPVARNIDANIAEVNLYRGQLDGISTVSKRFPNSNNYVALVATDKDYVVVEAHIRFYERSQSQIGIYPLINGNQAYQSLEDGKGIVLADLDKGNKTKIIKKMSVGYFESDVYFEYLEPVYIFEGEGFSSIVWAINSEHPKK